MPDPEFQCSTCEATFDTTAALLEHRRTPNSSETGIGGAPHRDRADSSHQATRTPESDMMVINHYDEHDQYGFIMTSEVSEDSFSTRSITSATTQRRETTSSSGSCRTIAGSNPSGSPTENRPRTRP